MNAVVVLSGCPTYQSGRHATFQGPAGIYSGKQLRNASLFHIQVWRQFLNCNLNDGYVLAKSNKRRLR